MDKTDVKILSLLQRDSSLTAEQVGEAVGLSKAPCWRRIQRLSEDGVIKRTVALLDLEKLNLRTTVFVMIRTSTHSVDWLERFSRAMQQFPDVMEILRMRGDIDYLIRIVDPDIRGYDDLYKRMIGAIEMSDVSASFVLETIKRTTELPLDHVELDT